MIRRQAAEELVRQYARALSAYRSAVLCGESETDALRETLPESAREMLKSLG